MASNRLIRLIIGTLVLGVLTAGVASAAPSGSSIPQGVWSGKNSQGLKMQFDVLLTKHGLTVQPTILDLNLVCSGTGTQIEAEFGFIGYSIKVHDDGTFGFHEYDELFGVVHLDGTLGDTSGSGTELIAIPGLTKDLGAETCTSGDVTWHARPPGGAPVQGGSPIQYRIIFTRDHSGHVTESITKG